MAELLLKLLLLVLLQFILHPDRFGAGTLEGIFVVTIRLGPCLPLRNEFADAESRSRHSLSSFGDTPSPFSLQSSSCLHATVLGSGWREEKKSMEEETEVDRQPQVTWQTYMTRWESARSRGFAHTTWAQTSVEAPVAGWIQRAISKAWFAF